MSELPNHRNKDRKDFMLKRYTEIMDEIDKILAKSGLSVDIIDVMQEEAIIKIIPVVIRKPKKLINIRS